MSRGVVAAALVAELIVLVVLLVIALDLYAHRRVEGEGGLNIWGYRGPVADQRQPNEIRVAMIGGTRAFGWGQRASGTSSAELQRLILLTTDRPGSPLRPVVVINLARLGALPDSYSTTIEHFAYLKSEYICIYDDLGVGGGPSLGSTSAIFTATGYMPVLPLVLREKGMVWRFGSVARGYESRERGDEPPASWLRRAAGSTLEAFGAAAGAVDRVVAQTVLSDHGRSSGREADAAVYAGAMMAAIATAHRHARGVVVAVSPSETPKQSRNLIALKARLDAQPVSSSWFRFVSLDGNPDLVDAALRLDGWSYGGAATGTAAAAIAPAVLDLIARP